MAIYSNQNFRVEYSKRDPAKIHVNIFTKCRKLRISTVWSGTGMTMSQSQSQIHGRRGWIW